MRKFVVILSLGWICLPGAYGQQTWNGLRFGMATSEAQQKMAAGGIRLNAADPSKLESLNDFDLNLAQPIPLEVELRFDPKIGLNMILLRADMSELHKRHPEISPRIDAMWIFGSMIYDALLSKYGKPLTQDGNREAMPSSESWNIGCSASWRTSTQTVDLEIGPAKDLDPILIAYKPQSGQL